MRNRSLFFYLVLLLCVVAVSAALEIKDNSSIISFNEKDGVWRLSYIQDGSMKSLFESRDDRTSYMTLMLDNRSYRLQKNSFFNQHVEEYPGLVVAHWSNKVLHVTQSIQRDHDIRGFRVTVTVRNLSRNYISVGLKNLIDSYNNDNGPDFTIPGNIPVNSERRWSASDVPSSWSTYPGEAAQISFTAMGDRKPDSLIFANWKRLNDSDWEFNYREGRDFSLMPYSINDSAAAVFYNPVSLPPGTEETVQFALTAGSPVIERSVEKAGSISEPVLPDELEDTPEGKQIILNYAMQYDLDLIDKMTSEIDSLLLTDDPVYNSQTEYFEEELEKLKQKLSRYENLQ